MNSIHPAWQSEDDEVPVRIVNREISRRPAAIVGMVLVIAAGFILFDGADSLTGQVTEDTPVSGPSIYITDTGFSPSTLEVLLGETVTWISQTQFPLTITSDILCSDNNFCLQSEELTNGQTHTFSITQDMAPGQYIYFTKETGMQGQIIVKGQEPIAPLPTPAPAPSTNSSITQNPFAIGNSPTPTPQPPVAQVIAETGGPIYQPQTGPQAWIAILGSLIGLLYVSRGMLIHR